ncbi:hypothetical protein J4E78_011096, partial [Alternaria triticimaculans]
ADGDGAAAGGNRQPGGRHCADAGRDCGDQSGHGEDEEHLAGPEKGRRSAVAESEPGSGADRGRHHRTGLSDAVQPGDAGRRNGNRRAGAAGHQRGDCGDSGAGGGQHCPGVERGGRTLSGGADTQADDHKRPGRQRGGERSGEPDCTRG